MSPETHDPLQPHTHDPNPDPPSGNPDFTLCLPLGQSIVVTPEALQGLPQTHLPDCYIVSTGHGTSGPFTFGGVSLHDFMAAFLPAGTGSLSS